MGDSVDVLGICNRLDKLAESVSRLTIPEPSPAMVQVSDFIEKQTAINHQRW